MSHVVKCSVERGDWCVVLFIPRKRMRQLQFGSDTMGEFTSKVVHISSWVPEFAAVKMPWCIRLHVHCRLSRAKAFFGGSPPSGIQFSVIYRAGCIVSRSRDGAEQLDTLGWREPLDLIFVINCLIIQNTKRH